MTGREIIFLSLGAGIGFAAGWWSLKTHYEEKYQEEITSVREALREDKEKDITENKTEEVVPEYKQITREKPDIMEYASKLAELRYTSNKGSEDIRIPLSVRVISPEEFREIDDYETITLTYYKGDDTLADELGEVVDEDIVGDALDHFGEYEDDCVHCRDDEKKCYYEILLDLRSYGDLKHPELEG